MEKESYSIDDILSEVKKRRAENEAQLKGETAAPAAQNPFADEVQAEEAPADEAFTLTGDDEPEAAAAEPETAFTFEEDEPVHTPDAPDFTTLRQKGGAPAAAEEAEKAEAEAAEPEAEVPEAEAEAPQTEAESPVFSETEEAEPEEAETEEAEAEEAETEAPQAEAAEAETETAADGEQMVDLLSLAAGTTLAAADDEAAEEKPKFTQTKKGKATISVICILVVLIVAAAVFAVLYANNMLNRVTNNTEEEPYEMVTYYDGMDFLQEDFPTIDEVAAGEIYSYKEYLKQWYENGDPVSSTHVLNLLLIGEDTREEEISDTSRADSAIICSVNIDTGEINLTSVLRDLYVYYEVDGVGQYGKINESAATGGMSTYIRTIERYYKISINNYAVVNFASFPKIIDALGGVEIEMTSAEIYEINNHPKRYGGVTITQSFTGDAGTIKLDGDQALAYCRIRKIDSDGARADRQKTVLAAILEEMRAAGTVDIVKTVNELAAYVYTGYSKSELIEIGNTALKDGWLNYEMETSNVPGTENCAGGQGFSAAPGTWIWLADIPKDAYELQMRIYGKSNINLNENRADYIAMGR